MKSGPEFQLENLIMSKSTGVKYFNALEQFVDQDVQTPQRCNKSICDKVKTHIRQALDVGSYQRLTLLLDVISYFARFENYDDGLPVLLDADIDRLLVKIFQEANSKLIQTDDNETILEPIRLMQKLFDTINDISDNSMKGKAIMVSTFSELLLELAVNTNKCFHIRMEAFKILNPLFEGIGNEARTILREKSDVKNLIQRLGRLIYTAGDFDMQIAIIEALSRMTLKSDRSQLSKEWFIRPSHIADFNSIRDQQFETDCRHFLNRLNSSMGDKQRVFSLPCLSASLGDVQMQKPIDENLHEFWTDFNSPGDLWETIAVGESDFEEYSVGDSVDCSELMITLKKDANELFTFLPNTHSRVLRLAFPKQYPLIKIATICFGLQKLHTTSKRHKVSVASNNLAVHKADSSGDVSDPTYPQSPKRQSLPVNSLSDSEQHSSAQLSGSRKPKVSIGREIMITPSSNSAAKLKMSKTDQSGNAGHTKSYRVSVPDSELSVAKTPDAAKPRPSGRVKTPLQLVATDTSDATSDISSVVSKQREQQIPVTVSTRNGSPSELSVTSTTDSFRQPTSLPTQAVLQNPNDTENIEVVPDSQPVLETQPTNSQERNQRRFSLRVTLDKLDCTNNQYLLPKRVDKGETPTVKSSLRNKTVCHSPSLSTVTEEGTLTSSAPMSPAAEPMQTIEEELDANDNQMDSQEDSLFTQNSYEKEDKLKNTTEKRATDGKPTSSKHLLRGKKEPLNKQSALGKKNMTLKMKPQSNSTPKPDIDLSMYNFEDYQPSKNKSSPYDFDSEDEFKEETKPTLRGAKSKQKQVQQRKNRKQKMDESASQNFVPKRSTRLSSSQESNPDSDIGRSIIKKGQKTKETAGVNEKNQKMKASFKGKQSTSQSPQFSAFDFHDDEAATLSQDSNTGLEKEKINKSMSASLRNKSSTKRQQETEESENEDENSRKKKVLKKKQEKEDEDSDVEEKTSRKVAGRNKAMKGRRPTRGTRGKENQDSSQEEVSDIQDVLPTRGKTARKKPLTKKAPKAAQRRKKTTDFSSQDEHSDIEIAREVPSKMPTSILKKGFNESTDLDVSDDFYGTSSKKLPMRQTRKHKAINYKEQDESFDETDRIVTINSSKKDGGKKMKGKRTLYTERELEFDDTRSESAISELSWLASNKKPKHEVHHTYAKTNQKSRNYSFDWNLPKLQNSADPDQKEEEEEEEEEWNFLKYPSTSKKNKRKSRISSKDVEEEEGPSYFNIDNICENTSELNSKKSVTPGSGTSARSKKSTQKHLSVSTSKMNNKRSRMSSSEDVEENERPSYFNIDNICENTSELNSTKSVTPGSGTSARSKKATQKHLSTSKKNNKKSPISSSEDVEENERPSYFNIDNICENTSELNSKKSVTPGSGTSARSKKSTQKCPTTSRRGKNKSNLSSTDEAEDEKAPFFFSIDNICDDTSELPVESKKSFSTSKSKKTVEKKYQKSTSLDTPVLGVNRSMEKTPRLKSRKYSPLDVHVMVTPITPKGSEHQQSMDLDENEEDNDLEQISLTTLGDDLNQINDIDLSRNNDDDADVISSVESVTPTTMSYKTPLPRNIIKSHRKDSATIQTEEYPKSGPSFRPGSTAIKELKRKYANLLNKEVEDVDEEDEDDMSEDDGNEELQQNVHIRPRKLFRLNSLTPAHTIREESVETGSSDISDTGVSSIELGVCNMLKDFGSELQGVMQKKTSHIEQIVNKTLSATKRQMSGLCTGLNESRQQLFHEFSDVILNEMVELEGLVDTLNETDEQFLELFKKQHEKLQSHRRSVEVRLNRTENIYGQFRVALTKLEEMQKKNLIKMKTSLKAEIAQLQKKVLKDMQEKEVMNMKRALKLLSYKTNICGLKDTLCIMLFLLIFIAFIT
ncbi:uncharacterized protein LOC102802393 [Saccoglossus kowalevskii]|uniref:Dentin sialophosphoprotein-like n=1 Tax=Saccoglossus kowalevskii TaxID=10224 RepID=A0ABM0MHT8_SACKO|nr:PREDICTED: dentin sialophosphoprotein-like [Saccoglossus kowalevskii]